MEISWQRQAKHFLELHNWKFIEGCYGSHPAFLLLEDLSTGNLILKFCEEFYSKSWESYKAVIESMSKLSLEEKQ